MAGVSAPQAVQVDSRIAGFDAAPLQAFGELGMRVADGLHNLQMERYEAQNKVHLADAQLEMAQTVAQFENWKLESNADPSTWDEAWKERADTIQAKFDSEQKFSPAARQALGLELKSWRGNTGIRVSTDAAKAVFQRAAEHDVASIRSAIAGGDIDAVRTIAESSKYLGADDKVNYLLQAQDARKQLDEKAALDADISRISENPRAWLTENADMKPQGYDDLKRMNYLKGQAQSMLQDQTQGATEEILNGFAMAGEKGRVMADEEIERMANGRLSPYALERLKEENASRYNAQEKARRASPDYQKELFGRTSAMIEQFDPLADGADDTLVELNMQIGQMSEGNSTELRARLNKKRDQANGKPVENTLQDAARKQLQEIMLKPSRFETQVKPSTAVLSGLLLDKGKMQQAGLSEAQAAAIAGVYKDKDKGGYRKAMERFREEINTIDRSKVQKGALGSYDQAAIDALMNGTDEMQTITDQQAKFNAHAEYGEAEKRMNEWFSKNPNADEKAVSEKLSEIIGAKTSLRVAPKLPGQGPKGAFDGTPDKVSASSAVDMIKQFEAGGAPKGFHEKAYWDYGQWSIGYGTKAKPGEVIDKAEAERRLANELASHRSRVMAHAEKHGYQFTPHQIDALTSFDYNTGSLEQLTANGTRKPEEIASKMLAYVKADGKTLKGLVNRRKAESNLFQNGY